MGEQCARPPHYLTTNPRKTRANGDTVTSPALSVAGFARPSLFARRINVTLRFGSVSTSDDDAFASTPYCQTTGSPLYVCTNQPIPCGSNCPFELSGFLQAFLRVSGPKRTLFLIARSNFAKSSTFEMRPEAAPSVKTLYCER